MTPRAAERGLALLMTLLTLGLFSSVAAGLALTSLSSRLLASNYDDAADTINAADTALQLATGELAGIADWNLVLTGAVSSGLVDGPPGIRATGPATSIDLVALTNELTCGSVNPCSTAQVQAVTASRPWAANNPRWRLFLHTPLLPPPAPRVAAPAYLIVWVGDDEGETDGDGSVDGGGVGQAGRYVLRARAEAFGSRGSRHAIEAHLVRVCTVSGGVETCAPGVRVQSWRSGVP